MDLLNNLLSIPLQRPSTGDFWLETLSARGLINYKDTTAKCRHLKMLTCKGTLRQVFICQLGPTTPPPLLTHCIRVFSTVLIHTGKRVKGVEFNQREIRGE